MMAAATAERDERGRFLPGGSGNPAGKRPGTRNRATLIAATLAEGEAEAMLRLVVDKALAGDGVAARYCLDRIMPRPRGRPIVLDLPETAGPDEIVAAFGTLLAAMAAGEITPEEALMVSRILDGKRRALETAGRAVASTGVENAKSGKDGIAMRSAHQETIPNVVPACSDLALAPFRSARSGEAVPALRASAPEEARDGCRGADGEASYPSALPGSNVAFPPPRLHSACKSWRAEGAMTALARVGPWSGSGPGAVAPPQLRGEIAALLGKQREGGLPPGLAIRFNGCEAAH